MRLFELNPHIRFASQITYSKNNGPVRSADCRIFYIIDGKADIFTQNQHYELQTGSLFYCRSQSIYHIETQAPLSLFSINFDLTQKDNSHTMPFTLIPVPEGAVGSCPLSVPAQESDFPVENSDFLNSHLFLPDASSFYRDIERICSEYAEAAPLFREMCSSLLKELLIGLHRAPKTASPSTVDFIMKYIEENYEKNLTNKDLAALAGYHEYHLNRLFLASTGVNLHSYLLKVRLNRAAHLILNTDLALQEIQEMVGFNSYPHFSSTFRQQFGFSPAQYRSGLKNRI